MSLDDILRTNPETTSIIAEVLENLDEVYFHFNRYILECLNCKLLKLDYRGTRLELSVYPCLSIYVLVGPGHSAPSD